MVIHGIGNNDLGIKIKIQKDLNRRRVGSLATTVPVSEFIEFEPRLESPQNRFQLSAGLNLEKCNTILSGTNHI